MGNFRHFIMSKSFLIIILLFFYACSSSKEKTEYQERSVEEIYSSAISLMKEKNYTSAAQEFEEVERQYPYSIWAKQAQIMNAYARYMKNDYDMAILASQRYVELHPGADDIDYAYYLIALSYYEQISDVKREQSMTNFALEAFDELIRRFPASIYSKDARQKLFLVRDHLAGKDMDVGRTYLSFDNYLAAIKRFKNVINNYPTTSHVPEALARLTELYFVLGVYEEAKASAAVLAHNFPNNYWHKYTYDLLSGSGAEYVLEETTKNTEVIDENIQSVSEENIQNQNPDISILDEILDFFNKE